MFKIGDLVKVISCDEGVDKVLLNKIGVIDKINPKDYYSYHIDFKNPRIRNNGNSFYWSENNIEGFTGDPDTYDDINVYEIPPEYKKTIVTTTNDVNGFKVKSYIDVISYEYIIGTGIISEITTSFQDEFGLRSTAFEEKMRIAKEYSMDKIKQNAFSIGGDAVIGLSLNFANFDKNRIALVISGTVVKLELV